MWIGHRKDLKVDVSSANPSSELTLEGLDEELTLETSALVSLYGG